MIKSYERLEQAILDCIIFKPELLKTTKLEDKHFKKYKRLWKFLKKCYELFGCLDITLMYRICPNSPELIDCIAEVIDGNHYSARFDLYQEQLIALYDDFDLIENIYNLSKKLYIRDIKIDEFKKELKELLGNEETN